SEKMVATATQYVARRAAGEPIAYIVGSAGFRGHTLLVDRNVLVPRPETEHLVDDAIEHLRSLDEVRALDVGTGSGAIACALAAALPRATVHASDVSPEALLVALANAHRLGVEGRMQCYLGDLTTPVRRRRYEAVLANLPYVPTGDIAVAPDPVSFEPRLALDGGPDGLDLYRRLLAEVPGMLLPGGILYMEAAPPTIGILAGLAAAAFPEGEIELGRDYGERERYVKVTTPV
ncbi:MAG TPA: peptide chain release factor N(5)-glutamine methyltransferase, partial [Candidatus Baltobacteraceae bacterium]|nr:peptide chain release factor N(5)-glutamine methyltransferase [Candidatus Baltobacteraceae bacterium]